MKARLQRLAVTAAFTFLVVLALLLLIGEPLTPDADDCAARGQAEDCWRSSL